MIEINPLRREDMFMYLICKGICVGLFKFKMMLAKVTIFLMSLKSVVSDLDQRL